MQLKCPSFPHIYSLLRIRRTGFLVSQGILCLSVFCIVYLEQCLFPKASEASFLKTSEKNIIKRSQSGEFIEE